MKSVRELLLAEGIDTAAMGWTLDSLRQEELYGDDPLYPVSADGRIIVGTGTSPSGKSEAWLVELPVPGDWDDNGFAAGSDFLIWQRAFGSTYDGEDYLDWRAYFSLTPRTQSLTAVPELSTVWMALQLAILLLHTWVRRR